MNGLKFSPQYHIIYQFAGTDTWKHVNRDFVSLIDARKHCQKVHDRFLDLHGDTSVRVILIHMPTDNREEVAYDGGVSHATA